MIHGIIRVHHLSNLYDNYLIIAKDCTTMQSELQSQLTYIKSIDPDQHAFVYYRSMLPTNEAALKEVGLSNTWLWRLPNKAELESLAMELRHDRLTQASIMLQQATIKAVSVMVDDLDSKDRKLRQAAARDILDRVGLRAPDKTQVEVMASVAVRALDDVLTQVYGKVDAPAPAGMIVDASFQDGDNVDNVDND